MTLLDIYFIHDIALILTVIELSYSSSTIYWTINNLETVAFNTQKSEKRDKYFFGLVGLGFIFTLSCVRCCWGWCQPRVWQTGTSLKSPITQRSTVFHLISLKTGQNVSFLFFLISFLSVNILLSCQTRQFAADEN